eukprot:TRINITY_DN171_c1_g1_i1.p1 TRINITY_DN171_c1_g1~~TRINITY_DN171_c1_g1_i1.p1  ORF type:complete len:319 (+),score=44.35 TRINITY_DN171_c1_g1_i1:142-1098(+)
MDTMVNTTTDYDTTLTSTTLPALSAAATIVGAVGQAAAEIVMPPDSVTFDRWIQQYLRDDLLDCLMFLGTMYFGATGFLWFFFYFRNGFINKATLNYTKIQPSKNYTWAIMADELYYSTLTILIGSALMACVVTSYRLGVSMLFWDPLEYGYCYFIGSVFVMFAFNDAFMYWVHRAFHTRLGFKIHKIHHRFSAPTPFATQANHPIESFILYLPVLLAIGPFPVHLPSLFLMFVFQVTLSITDHLGFSLPFFEPVSHAISSPVHHDLHHSVYRCNYGVYFTFWDRYMGTLVDSSLDDHKRSALRREQGVISRKDTKTE